MAGSADASARSGLHNGEQGSRRMLAARAGRVAGSPPQRLRWAGRARENA